MINTSSDQKTAQQSVHLTLGILRTLQAVSYAVTFFWLDGFAVPAPAQVTHAVRRLRINNISWRQMMGKNIIVLVILLVMLSACGAPATPIDASAIQTAAFETVIAGAANPFVMPTGDFKMSWDTYSSEYNSLGGILTIHKQGSIYTQTLVMSDKSCGATDLTVISEGDEIKLTDRPGNSFGDYMVISSNGYLNFYDKQGIIYSVPPLSSEQAPITECVQPQAEKNKEINVIMSVLSVESIGGNKVKITVTTNLPDGMKLMVDLKDSGSYWAQDDPTINSGKLVTTFGNVSAGSYRLTITSPTVSIQPDNVKAILGENGKNMIGELVTFDQSWGSYFLEYTSNIEVK